MSGEMTQRIRLTFSRGEELKYLSHLDLMRLWERALRRADLPLARTEGFNPHPRLAIASPLAVGFTAQAELMDLFLAEPVAPDDLDRRVRPQLPTGIGLVAVAQVALTLPALPAQVRAAVYLVSFRKDDGDTALRDRIAALLAAESLPRERARENRTIHYDLRPLVEELRLVGEGDRSVQVEMRLRSDSSGTGRPDEVARQLGVEQAQSICRTRLVLAE
jgi:radical SAM-linked protein